MVRRRRLEVILSVLAGIIIIAEGITFLAGIFIGLPSTDETLNEIREELGEEGFRFFEIRNVVAGISTGGAILLLSHMLNKRPEESKRWGAMIVILSAISILGMGFVNLGTLPGVILGVAGGGLAITRGLRIPVPETRPEAEPERKPGAEIEFERRDLGAEPKTPEGPFIYRCSICNIDFRSDEELRAHVVRMHMEHR